MWNQTSTLATSTEQEVLPQLVLIGLIILVFIGFAVWHHYRNGTASFIINPMAMITQRTIKLSSNSNLAPGNV